MRIYPLILIILFFSCNPSLTETEKEMIEQSEELLAEVKTDRDTRIVSLLIRMQSSVRSDGFRLRDKEIFDSAMIIYKDYQNITQEIESSGIIPPKDSLIFAETDPEFIYDFQGDIDYYSSSVPQILCFESRYVEEIMLDLANQVGHSRMFDNLDLNIISDDDSVQVFFSNAIYACGYIINEISVKENLDASAEIDRSPWAKISEHQGPELMRIRYIDDNGEKKEKSFGSIKTVQTIP